MEFPFYIKTIKQIFDITNKTLNISLSYSTLLEIFKPIYYQFELYDMILLRSEKISL